MNLYLYKQVKAELIFSKNYHDINFFAILSIFTLSGKECAENKMTTSSLSSSGNLANSSLICCAWVYKKSKMEDEPYLTVR